MPMFKAEQRTIRIEERYIEAEDEQEASRLLYWEDVGCDNAHFKTINKSGWEIEEDE